MHLGEGDRNVAQPQAAKAEEGQEHRLTREGFASEGFHPDDLGRTAVYGTRAGLLPANQVAQQAIAHGALRA